VEGTPLVQNRCSFTGVLVIKVKENTGHDPRIVVHSISGNATFNQVTFCKTELRNTSVYSVL
jgi:hypothetical protein